jgi:hypothetical protein
MSAGSNNIVIQVTDEVAGTIAPKIREIGAAAREANSYLVVLQGAVNDLGGKSGALKDALDKTKGSMDTTGASTGRLTGAIAQLAGRVAGAEAGFGMLGGAIARVGVAAGVAGPLIAVALAAAAVVGAVLIYDKLQENALKLAEAQTKVAETTNQLNDGLLKQQENLIGLTQGPLAKYRAELADLDLKSISVDVQDINKQMGTQTEWWLRALSALTRYEDAIASYNEKLFNPDAAGKGPGQGPTTNSDTKQFETQLELRRQQGQLLAAVDANTEKQIADAAAQYQKQSEFDQKTSLENKILQEQQYISQQKQLLQQETDNNDPFGAKETAQSLANAEQFYNRDLQAYQKYINDKKTLQTGANGEFLAQERKAAEALLQQYNDDLSRLKDDNGGVVTPQQTLALRQDQRNDLLQQQPNAISASSPYHNDLVTLDKDIGNAQQSIDRQNRSLEEYIEKEQAAAQAAGAYTAALRLQVDQQKNQQEVQKLAPGNTNDSEFVAQLNSLSAAKEAVAGYNAELKKLSPETDAARLKQLDDELAANATLFQTGAESVDRYQGTFAKVTQAYRDSTTPLNAFNRGIGEQTALFGNYGTALTVATEIQKERDALLQQDHVLSTQEAADLEKMLTLFEQQKAVQQAVSEIYNLNAGAVEKLQINQEALNLALQKGVITQAQYIRQSQQITVGLANQGLATGQDTSATNFLISALGALGTQGTSVSATLSADFNKFGVSLEDGVAGALAKAVVQGDKLSETLRKVAQQSLQQLITALIKLEMQLIVDIVKAAILDALTGGSGGLSSGAGAGTSGSAGSGAIQGTGSNAGTYLAVATGGFITGPGGPTDDAILGALSNGEYVVNARATAHNREMLDFLNSGGSLAKTSNMTPGTGATRMNVSVIHDGSTGINVRQMSDDHIQVVARAVAKNVVAQDAPGVISSDLQNPNSRTSKALRQNTDMQRKR